MNSAPHVTEPCSKIRQIETLREYRLKRWLILISVILTTSVVSPGQTGGDFAKLPGRIALCAERTGSEVSRAPELAPLQRAAQDRLSPLIALSALVRFCVLCFALHQWGRQRIAPMAANPSICDRLSPEEVRIVSCVGCDARTFIAAILGLLEQKRICIEQRMGEFVVSSAQQIAADDSAQPFERTLFLESSALSFSESGSWWVWRAYFRLRELLEDTLWSQCFSTNQAKALVIRFVGVSLSVGSPFVYAAQCRQNLLSGVGPRRSEPRVHLRRGLTTAGRRMAPTHTQRTRHSLLPQSKCTKRTRTGSRSGSLPRG